MKRLDPEQPIATTPAGVIPAAIPSTTARDWALRTRPAAQELPASLGVITEDGPRERVDYPALPANGPFWLVYMPGRWCVLDDGNGGGHVVAPSLRNLRSTPGADGVGLVRRPDGTALPDMRVAFENIKERGEYLIPHDVDGPGTTYLRRVQVGSAWHPKTGEELPLWHYTTRFTATHRGSSGYTTDAAAYAAWLVGLVASGKLPAPSPPVLDGLESQYEGMLERAQRKYQHDPQHHLVANYRGALAAIRKERARLYALVASEIPLEVAAVTEGEHEIPPTPAPVIRVAGGQGPGALPPEPREPRRRG